MNSLRVRTDLALEVRENMEENARECRGVSVEEDYREESELRITKVVIETMNGARAMGKPIGTYVTLEAPAMVLPDEDYHQEISKDLDGKKNISRHHLCEAVSYRDLEEKYWGKEVG